MAGIEKARLEAIRISLAPGFAAAKRRGDVLGGLIGTSRTFPAKW